MEEMGRKIFGVVIHMDSNMHYHTMMDFFKCYGLNPEDFKYLLEVKDNIIELDEEISREIITTLW